MGALEKGQIAMLLESKAHDYAVKCHEAVNQKYDDKSYAIHLGMVNGFAYMFLDLETSIADDQYRDIILSATWCHDLIEDARQTYNDIKNNTSQEISEIVYALTTEKGKTRAERANDKYYDEMKKFLVQYLLKFVIVLQI